MQELSKEVKLDIALAYASGTAARNGAIIDMSGWDGIVALVHHATIAASAVGDIHWEQGDESDLSDSADLAGTKIAIADDDDDQLFISDLYRPTDRYVRIVVTKDGSNAQAESAIYVRYKGSKAPVTNAVADTVEHETHVSPAEGTK